MTYPIRDILFDLDDTLFDFHADERVALTQTFAALGITLTEEIAQMYSRINQAQWQALERGEITRARLMVRRYELLFAELGKEPSLAVQAAELYPQYLSQSWHYIDGARQLLERLRGTYRLYLVSNGNLSVQRGRLAHSGIGAYFDGIFISEEIGAEKPDVRFFDAVFAAIPQADRARTVIVGDSLTSDMQGGKNAGIRTIWYHRSDTEGVHPLADHIIRSLEELPELLEQLSADPK